MLYSLLSKALSDTAITCLATAIAAVLTFILYKKPAEFLPRDGGKTVTDKDGNLISINAQSKGKVTGAGLIFVIIFLGLSLLLVPFSVERLLYIILMFAMMLTGYLDDASRAPWGELVKGLLDLVLALLGAIIFVCFNDTTVILFGNTFHIPAVIYAILGVALIWGSINVTNCSDGVDGLCGGVTIVELIGFTLIFSGNTSFGDFGTYGIMTFIFTGVLIAYLAYNWNPSRILMGDAGSRTIGFFIALLAMKSGHPFSFILMSFVFLFDGGLGLVKLVFLRTIHKNIFGKIRFPFHDELRKNRGWRIPKISIFFIVCEIVCVLITWVIAA